MAALLISVSNIAAADSQAWPYQLKQGLNTGVQTDGGKVDVYMPQAAMNGELLPVIFDHHPWLTPKSLYRFFTTFISWLGGTSIPDLAEERGVIIIWPSSLNFLSWNSGDCCVFLPINRSKDDVAQILKVVEWAKEELPVDPRRIYAMGVSNGAEMTNRLALDAAEVFAAYAPISYPFFNVFGRLDGKLPSRPVPILEVSPAWDISVPLPPCFGRPTCSAHPTPRWVLLQECNTDPVVEKLPRGGELRTYTNCNGGVEFNNLVFPALHGAYFNFARVDFANEAFDFLFQHALPEENL